MFLTRIPIGSLPALTAMQNLLNVLYGRK